MIMQLGIFSYRFWAAIWVRIVSFLLMLSFEGEGYQLDDGMPQKPGVYVC